MMKAFSAQTYELQIVICSSVNKRFCITFKLNNRCKHVPRNIRISQVSAIVETTNDKVVYLSFIVLFHSSSLLA